MIALSLVGFVPSSSHPPINSQQWNSQQWRTEVGLTNAELHGRRHFFFLESVYILV